MQKISIKREQSQASLSFAERENRRSAAGGKAKFRPQVKNKLFLLLALLLTAATGAWADTTVTWSASDMSQIYIDFDEGTAQNNTIKGITATGSTGGDGRWDGDNISAMNAINTITFTSSVGNIKSIAIKAESISSYPQGGWTLSDENKKLSWSGEASSTVSLTLSAWDEIDNISEIVFTIESAPAPAATTYTVSLADGVKDADKWTITPTEATTTGVAENTEVTLQYTGRLKVKGVKATSDAAEASIPDGALSGKFSVSATKQVNFSKGNLRYASSKWSFFDNQYDYNTSYSADAWDHFGWSTSATDYGMSTSTSLIGDYSGDFVDWGATMGTGWFTLSKDEWKYLLNTRSASTVGGTENGRYAKAKVNDVKGVILFPDTYTHPDGVTAPTGVNATDATGWNVNSYTVEDWTKMESAGCVFLPAAGYRGGSEMVSPGTIGYYWSATPSNVLITYSVYFNSSSLDPVYSNNRYFGYSVRLVQEATSDAPAVKPAASVTTAPTGAAVVGVGKTTKLVSGGAAEGGTLMYAVTTTNTKPASTDGFSDAVPTAQDITASGTVYVWYYVKGDDTHSDSEIAGPVSVTVTPALSLTNPVVGQVIGSDGKNYAAAATLPTGVTKVAMIAYVSGSNGLAIALADEGSLNWEAAKSTCEAKTPAFTNGTWHLPSQAEWNQMFSANGGDEERCYGLNAAINTAGGTALLEGGTGYWSSTPDGSKARYVWLMDGDTDWRSIIVAIGRQVRACLAF